ncbi:MAG TPA: HAD-IA family hydrolase [Candidatus Binatia bacterium]|nr:HAD-IA family hydrolase [Candidatus Binatia bacterium]
MRVLLLDVDETLYPRGNGVLRRIDARINSFMVDRLGIAAARVDAERVLLRDRFGTTLRGLTEQHAIDVDEYLLHCHGVDLSDLLAPDPRLRALLERVPLRKAVLTNGPRAHALRVLDLLGVADLMECVLALEDLAYAPKPSPSAYGSALDRLGVPAEECLFVDDTLAFARAAAEQGMRAAWVAPPDAPREAEGVHHVIRDVHEVEDLL